MEKRITVYGAVKEMGGPTEVKLSAVYTGKSVKEAYKILREELRELNEVKRGS